MDASAANPTNQSPSATGNAAQRPFARKNHHGQPSASCTLCRRRKVRCDRGVPCGSCKRAGEECVPFIPSHAPRGRQGGRKRKTDGELLERIAKLEGFLKKVEGNSNENKLTPCSNKTPTADVGVESPRAIVVDISDHSDRSKRGSSEVISHTSQNPESGLDRYLGTSFWVTLSEEISGLRDVLNGSSDQEDEAEGEHTPASSLSSPGSQQLQLANDSRFIISPSSHLESPGNPTPHQLYNLCEIYLNNVDLVFKILHAPSLRRYLQEGAADLDCSPGARGLEALKFAVCYAATVSMTEGECRLRIGEDKAVLMAKYRAGTELALAKADLLNTVEMSTLQAMTIYLASVRVNDTRRLMWTLTSLAVRIAQAMGLHHENPSSTHRPFAREMRRRLWWQICLLDSHAADDRATNPVVSADSFNTELPLQINDEDLQVDLRGELEDRQGFTDMTFSLICFEIVDTIRQLNYVPIRKLGQSRSGPQENWTQRIDAVTNVQRCMEEKYLRHLKLDRPFHWATRLVADIMTAIMWLVVYRPLQQHPDSRPFPLADPGILALSVEVLERAHQLDTDPAASSFRWISQTYVHWHALAVTIAELCIKTEGLMVERAWAIVIPAFSTASQHVADSQEGMLWRPIKKLMDRAQALRQEYLSSRSASAELATIVADCTTSGRGNNGIDTEHQTFGMFDSSQQVVEGGTPMMEDYHMASIPGSAPFDWDPWLAAASTSTSTGPAVGSQYNYDTNQIAWTNWENFVDGFQGQDESMLSEPSGEAPDFPRLWP